MVKERFYMLTVRTDMLTVRLDMLTVPPDMLTVHGLHSRNGDYLAEVVDLQN